MKTLLLLINNFFKLTFNKKANYLIFFVLPVACVVLMFLIFGSPKSSGFSIGYLNHDPGPLGEALITYLKTTEKNRLKPITEQEINSSLIDSKINAALIIPADFSASLLAGSSPQPELVALQEDAAAGFIRGDVNRFIGSIQKLVTAAAADDTLFTELYAAFQQSPYTLQVAEIADITVRKEGGIRGIGMLMFFISIQAIVITGLMLKEKQDRTFYRIIMAPLREILYPLANMLAAFIILSLQICITLLVVVYLLRFDPGIPLWQLIPLLLANSLAVIGIGIFITAVASSTVQSAILANLVVSFSCMLSGCFWPLSFMSQGMQKLAVIFPQTWVMQILEKLQNGAAYSSAGLPLLMQLGFAGLFVCLYAFRVKQNRQLGSFI